jgi:hypothetical protein
MFIDANTSRSNLLAAIDSDDDLMEAFIAANKDPDYMETEQLRGFIIDWIEAGDECANS